MKPKNPNAAVKNIRFTGPADHKKPVLHGLTRDIIIDGNPDTLKKFYANNEARLTDAEKDYMAARIASAERIKILKEKAEDRVAEGKLPPTPEPDETDGFVGFSGLRGDGTQTSGNGCWSYSLAIQLKARGVDIAQEDIRGWRPDQSLNPLTEEQKKSPGYQSNIDSMIYRTNADTPNSLIQTADLVHDLLPNTAVEQISLPPIYRDSLAVDGREPSRSKIAIVQRQAIAEAKKLLRETIERAIRQDHSPISILYNHHYTTITGISRDGKIRFEDSVQKTAAARTRFTTLDELAQIAVLGGMELSWLRDLPKPEYEKRAEECGNICPPDPKDAVRDKNGKLTDVRMVTVNENGDLRVDVPHTSSASKTGQPSEGRMVSEGFQRNITMDMGALKRNLGGKQPYSFGPDGALVLSYQEVSLPKKVRFLRDPALQKNVDKHALEARHEKTYRSVQGPLTQALQNLKALNDPKKAEKEQPRPLPEGMDGKKLLEAVREFEQTFTHLKYSAMHNGEDLAKLHGTLRKAREFGAFLQTRQGNQTVYQVLMAQMPPEQNAKFARGVHELNDALNLDINFDALGPRELADPNELDYRDAVAEARTALGDAIDPSHPENITVRNAEQADQLAKLMALEKFYKDQYPVNLRAPVIDYESEEYREAERAVRNSYQFRQMTEIRIDKTAEQSRAPDRRDVPQSNWEDEYTPTGDPEDKPDYAQESGPENPDEGLEALKAITNARDYIEALQRRMNALPARDPSPAQKQQLALAAVSIIAARAAINAKAGSYLGGALDQVRAFYREASLMQQIGKSSSFRNYIKNTPYEKLRGLVLTGHGGEMEKSFRGFIAKSDKLPEDIPDRLMPTAKERCEELQNNLRNTREEVRREGIYRELIAARMAVGAKTGGENLGRKPDAKEMNRLTDQFRGDPKLRNILANAARDSKAQALALKGHGGTFMARMLEASQRGAAAPEMAKG